MPITVNCHCQNPFRVRDALAGKKIKCPYCETEVRVPEAGTDFDFQQAGSLESSFAPSMPPDDGSSDIPQYVGAKSPFAQPQTFDQSQPHEYDNSPASYPSERDRPPSVFPELDDGSYENPYSGEEMDPNASHPASHGVNIKSVALGAIMTGGGVLWLASMGAKAGRLPVYLLIFGVITLLRGLFGRD